MAPRAGKEWSVSRIMEERGYCVRASKQAAKTAHPDLGGDKETFRRLQDAKQLLTS